MLGKTLPEIMEALGHSTPTVALWYIHLSDVHKRRVAAEMSGQLDEWAGVKRIPAGAQVVEDGARAVVHHAAQMENSEALISGSFAPAAGQRPLSSPDRRPA